MVVYDEDVSRIIIDTIEYYTEYAKLEEIPIDILRCMYRDQFNTSV